MHVHVHVYMTCAPKILTWKKKLKIKDFQHKIKIKTHSLQISVVKLFVELRINEEGELKLLYARYNMMEIPRNIVVWSNISFLDAG